MKGSMFFSRAALGALAVALAATAIPASADAQSGRSDRNWSDRGSRDAANERPARAQRADRSGGQSARSQPTPEIREPMARQRPQPVAQAPQRAAPTQQQTVPQAPATRSSRWDGNGDQARNQGRNEGQRDRRGADMQGDQRRFGLDPNRVRDNDRNRDRDYRDNDRNRDYRDSDRNRTYRDDRRADRRSDYRDNRNAYRNGYRDGRQAENHRRWDRRWRDNRRYNWHGYRNANRSTFRLGVYYSPYRSYSYRRLGIGFYLDNLFYGSRYWINDPWHYRLPEVYGPYRWVRYYDDVLLVNIYTGEVVDVIYDFFW